MKVAYIGIKGLPAKAGADRVVEAVVTRMPGLGVISTVYCDSGYTPPSLSSPGINIIRLPAVPGKQLRSLTHLVISSLHALLFGDYDLIHLQHIESSFVIPLLRLRYPVLATSHGFAYWREKWNSFEKAIIQKMDSSFARFSSEITCVSKKDALDIGMRFKRTAHYIPNGVGIEFSPNIQAANTILHKHGLEPGKYLIFAAGRIEPTKGAHLAIKAVNLLPNPPELLIVGNDHHVPEYRTSLRNMSGENIHFEPLIEDAPTLFGLMASSACLVFPSLFEAMSMVLLEAASLGVPVICSDIYENRVVMEDDAYYFVNGDEKSLAEQIHLFMHDKETGIKMAEGAKLRIHRDYSWDSISKQYLAVYCQMTSSLSNSGKTINR